MQNEIEYKGLRRKLNGCYENFTALLGDLNLSLIHIYHKSS